MRRRPSMPSAPVTLSTLRRISAICRARMLLRAGQGVNDAAQVGVDGQFGGPWVVGPDRGDDREVFGQRLGGPPRLHGEPELMPDALRTQPFQHGGGRALGADLPDAAVQPL